MAVLVTGGAGFIGSQVARKLTDEVGRDVVVLDDLSRGDRARVPRRAFFVEGRVGDEPLVQRVIQEHRISAIMHFAGFIDVAESVADPRLYYSVNSKESALLIHRACAMGVKHFIFSSTAAVYGTPTSVPVKESAMARPANPYGKSKRIVERILAGYWSGTYATLRYFNVVGGGYSHVAKPAHLFRAAFEVAMRRTDGRQKLPVYGKNWPTPDGTAIRDFIHIHDLVDAHVCALRYLEHGGESDVFNVGYGRGYSVLEAIKTIEKVSRKEVPFKVVERRPGDVAAIFADATKAREVLGWQPRCDKDFEGMIREQWDYERGLLLPVPEFA